MMPSKGDTVRAVVEGQYSHRGNQSMTATGFHIVTVDGRDVALPPGTDFEVVARWQPKEPDYGSLLVDHSRREVYRRRLSLCPGEYEEVTSGRWFYWTDLLLRTSNGATLTVYNPAGKVE